MFGRSSQHGSIKAPEIITLRGVRAQRWSTIRAQVVHADTQVHELGLPGQPVGQSYINFPAAHWLPNLEFK